MTVSLPNEEVKLMSSFPGSKVLQNDEFTKDLFRFLQLLCEGHNNGGSKDRQQHNTKSRAATMEDF